LFDEQVAQVQFTIDPMVEQVRQFGGTVFAALSHIARLRRIADKDVKQVTPQDEK
jgi:DNA-binding ferritin-like protein